MREPGVRPRVAPVSAALFFTAPEADARAAALANLEARLHAGRPARQAARELEQFSRSLWSDAGLGPWPDGWTVKWADLRGRRDAHGRPSAGLCVSAPHRLILIDAAAHDAYTFRGDELVRTLLHEFAHVVNPHEGHGPAFLETERRLVAQVLPVEPAPIAAARPVVRPRPAPYPGRPGHGRVQPPMGQRPYRGRWITTPGLDPTLEYRG